MFIDEINLELIAWKWWGWLVSFRREKYIAKWGPDGWDGWRWWNIILRATNNLNTLSEYRHKKVLKAKNWVWWGTCDRHWANWEDLILKVPIWTLVKDLDTWELIHDLKYNNEELIIAKGWRWGYWNAHFVSSTRQIPRFAELGDIWEEKHIKLELKLVADIWLLWMPSAWKSTLISVLTNARPKVAEYHFTTLTPNLWILDHKWRSIVIEDVPWLIPWASEWKWLWIKFLKHIERTWILIHLLDISRWDDIFEEYLWLRKELHNFSKDLSDKKEIIFLSKIDEADSEIISYYKEELEKRFNREVYPISSFTHEWLDKIKDLLINITPIREIPDNEEKFIFNEELEEDNSWLALDEKWNIIKDFISDDVIIDNKKIEFNLEKSIKQAERDTRELEQLEREWLKMSNKKVKKYDLIKQNSHNNYKILTIDSWKLEIKWDRIEQIVRMTDAKNHEAIMRIYDILSKRWIDKEVNKIFNKRNIDLDKRIITIAGVDFKMNKINFV